MVELKQGVLGVHLFFQVGGRALFAFYSQGSGSSVWRTILRLL